MAEPDFPARASAWGAWTGLERQGLIVRPVENDAICLLTARNSCGGQVRTAIRDMFSLEAPQRLGCAGLAGTTLIASAPQSWLLVQSNGPRDLSISLAQQFGPLASVSDQSGAYARLRMSGPGGRFLLQKGAFLDLDPTAFAPGAAASTHIAHIGVILWRPGLSEDIEVAVYRSYAQSFAHWIEFAAA